MAASTKNLLYKIAKAYYEDNLTQEEIGRRFGMSRIKISRMLQQARDEKIVQITIVPPHESNTELEREIEACFGLYEVVVTTLNGSDTRTVNRELGQAAANYLLRILQGHEVLTISWGTTLAALVDVLPSQFWPEMKIVQMLGGLGQPESETYGGDLIHRLAQTFNARPRIIPAPGIVKSKLVRDALLADPQISDTLALAAKADVALVGIGQPTRDSVVMRSGILADEELAQLNANGAVGDIALRFFGTDGQAVQHEICDRIIGLDLLQIQKIPRVIGVAGGETKFPVIRAALRGRLINVLVTDDQTALRLLEDGEETYDHAGDPLAAVAY